MNYNLAACAKRKRERAELVHALQFAIALAFILVVTLAVAR